MPAMGEQIEKVVDARVAGLQAKVDAMIATPEGEKVTADLLEIRDDLTTLVEDVKALAAAAVQQAAVPPTQ